MVEDTNLEAWVSFLNQYSTCFQWVFIVNVYHFYIAEEIKYILRFRKNLGT